jgi:hypothetical protein
VDLDFLKIGKLFKAFQVFEILSKFKEEKKCYNFRQLHCKILKNEIPFEEFVDQLRKTLNEEINKKSLIDKIKTFLEFDDSVLSSLKPPENTPFGINHNVSFRNLLERMVVACVHKHVKEASLPKHNSSYNTFVMKRFNKWEDLVSNYFDRLLLAKVKEIEHRERRKLRAAKRKLQRVETLIQKVKDFRVKCPLEKRCFPFSQTQLSYSGEDLPTFSNKRKMFEFLKLEGYGDDMLTKLDSLNLCNVLTYDFKGEFRRNSRYLHGCSLYMQGNLNKSKCAENFYCLMLKDLETHYDQKNINAKIPLEFGENKKAWLKRVCQHVHYDSQIYSELQRMESNDEEQMLNELLGMFPECLTRDGFNSEFRRQHFQWLIKARLKNVYPFN